MKFESFQGTFTHQSLSITNKALQEICFFFFPSLLLMDTSAAAESVHVVESEQESGVYI